MPYFLLIILNLFVFSVCNAANEGDLGAGLTNPGYVEKPTWFKSSFLDIREDIAEAAELGKGTILYFHQDGCPYCEKLIKDNFTDGDIVEKTRKGFDVVAINLWGDKDVVDFSGNDTTEKQFSVDLKVMFTPTLLFVDPTGRVLLRMNGYFPKQRFTQALDYISAKKYQQLSFNQYLAKKMTHTGSINKEDYFMHAPFILPAEQRDSEKLLLVLFEEGDCAACDELHNDILKRPETKAAISAYDVVQLDMHANTPVMTPDGQKLMAKDWAKQLGIQYAPSMVFFDKHNKEVFRTEAYLKTFHTVAALKYVSDGEYLKQPEFQRYVQDVADHMREEGLEVDLMK